MSVSALLNSKGLVKQVCITANLLISSFLFSQNLIPNPSFELYDTCPSGASQIYRAQNWFQPCTFWGNITNSSSTDYYNSCSSNTVCSVPQNLTGYQYSNTGNAHAGIIVFYSGNNIREYLETKLISQLESGKLYCFSILTSPAETRKYFTNSFGCLFTNDTLKSSSCDQITIPSSINFITEPIVTDTGVWTKLSGAFFASGNENFITIGNFNSNSLTQTDTNSYGFFPQAYYYFDDISLLKIEPPDAGKDTAICPGNAIILGNDTTTDATYHWQPPYALSDTNAMHPLANPTLTTTYILTKTICKATLTDTITVFASCPGFDEYAFKNQLKVYPSPANDNICIENTKNCEGEFQLVDVTGKIILLQQISSFQAKVILTIQDIKEGLYYFRFVKNGRIIQSDKLVIVK